MRFRYLAELAKIFKKQERLVLNREGVALDRVRR